jgi:hypothetical protein
MTLSFWETDNKSPMMESKKRDMKQQINLDHRLSLEQTTRFK